MTVWKCPRLAFERGGRVVGSVNELLGKYAGQGPSHPFFFWVGRKSCKCCLD